MPSRTTISDVSADTPVVTPPLSPLSPTTNGSDGNVFPTTTLPLSVSESAPSLISDLSDLQMALRSAESLVSSKRKMRVLLLSSDTGGGHRASAQALQAALEQLHPGQMQINIVDFWVEMAEGAFTNVPNNYVYMAKHPWLWKATYEFTRFPPGRAFTETVINSMAHRKIREAFLEHAPDLIISVHPLVNTISHRVLRRIRASSGIPTVPYVTVVTDLGGAHPTWFHKAVDMTYIPTDGVGHVAKKVGVPRDKIRQLGLPVREQFWRPPSDKAQLRSQLGLLTDTPAVLVVGGGDGVGGLKRIVETLATSLAEKVGDGAVQLVVVCGKNQSLRKHLSFKNWPLPLTALGYISNMSEWMGACDIICTKAGPGTIAEALICGIPIVVTGYLPGQEEANVKYVVDKGVGQFAKKPQNIVDTVAKWLQDPALLASMSQRATQCGRPDATMAIASDIVDVAKVKIDENIAAMEKEERLRSQSESERAAQQALIPYSPPLEDSDSHLFYRVRFLLRIVLGSVLVKEALNHEQKSLIMPPTSPVGSPRESNKASVV